MVACWPVNNPFCMKSKMGEVGLEVLISKTDWKPFLLKKTLPSMYPPCQCKQVEGCQQAKMVACWPVNNPFCMKSKMGEVGLEVLYNLTLFFIIIISFL